MGTEGCLTLKMDYGMEVTTHVRLVSRLGIHGPIVDVLYAMVVYIICYGCMICMLWLYVLYASI